MPLGLGDLDGENADSRPSSAPGVARWDRLQNLEAGGYLAEHRMFSVKPRRGDVSYEELRSVGIWSGIGHAQHTGAVVSQGGMELIGETVTRPAAPRPGGITCLG